MKKQVLYSNLVSEIDVAAEKALQVATEINESFPGNRKNELVNKPLYCGYYADRWQTLNGIVIDYIFSVQEKIKQFRAAEAADSAKDKGQEDKTQTLPAAAGGADGQCFDYATSVHFLLKNVEVAVDRANLLAGDMKSLHIDHAAHTRFDMLQGELCKIGQYIADFRDTYESGEQTETLCTCGGCDNCKDNEAAGGVQA